MKMSDKLYDVLKYACTIGIGALSTFLGTVLPVFGVPDNIVKNILTVLGATALLIGTLIGISNAQYKKAELGRREGTITVLNVEDEDEDDGSEGE
jgi:hypothetical protein